MLGAGVLVQVIGFTDVERHALNTVFRLSREREVVYAPWNGTGPTGEPPPVLLVDGDCAEAVLSSARAPHESQRLIWVGSDAPDHAWRVLERPISWADLLHDLDAVFAATQSDSGLLDLDVTQPAPLDIDVGNFPQSAVRRALVVGVGEEEGLYLRTRLSLAAVPFVDEARTTERAAECISQFDYLCGVFNLDDHHIDAWGLMQLFRERYPQAMTLAITELASPRGGWWRRRRVQQHTRRLGVSAVLPRPLQPPVVSQWLDML
ncbi:hypothetical protein [Hydrogenophaga crocea]|uniref:Response regulatory domain-containing protein n=1 Tax=Hydrogenophaga crocea TaxID=2716225 RepID=A0A6G8IGG6_9BURK|nr:hypothetical protein [Hydrogenophaga crocea]QIM52135.1 hypothetical protein G9Q37_08280 [Hydrogenophaga crocea]